MRAPDVATRPVWLAMESRVRIFPRGKRKLPPWNRAVRPRGVWDGSFPIPTQTRAYGPIWRFCLFGCIRHPQPVANGCETGSTPLPPSVFLLKKKIGGPFGRAKPDRAIGYFPGRAPGKLPCFQRGRKFCDCVLGFAADRYRRPSCGWHRCDPSGLQLAPDGSCQIRPGYW